jgi:hypothetical protein
VSVGAAQLPVIALLLTLSGLRERPFSGTDATAVKP